MSHSHFRPSRAPRRFQGWAQTPQEGSLPPASTHLWESSGALPACHAGCNGPGPLHLQDLCLLLSGSTEPSSLFLVNLSSGLVSGVGSSREALSDTQAQVVTLPGPLVASVFLLWSRLYCVPLLALPPTVG